MSELRYNNSRSRISRKRKRSSTPFIVLVILLITALIGIAVFFFYRYKDKLFATSTSSQLASTEAPVSSQSLLNPEDELRKLIETSDRLAASYDYDKAIELLKNDVNYASDSKVLEAIAGYEASKASLVKQDPSTISHVFFHSLIVDKSKAFDGDHKQTGYNQVMTTLGEFEKILQSMYDRGFVLVRMHDMAELTTDENGATVMKYKDIMLPEGKKAVVMSQDDVCYYEFMVGDGFASRLVIGEDGRVTCEMDMDDGTSVVGDYDLIPILNKFIDEHPDFSYKGAKAIIALTGYNGIFGYRTDSTYSSNPTFEEDKKKAMEIAEALRADGWEIASHSWGHRHLGRVSDEIFTTDSNKWENEVETLVGPTDILIYPFGTDVGDWRNYTEDNSRYVFLRDLGFHYFCNVDSSTTSWVQLGKDYLRQGRINLDGYRMNKDIKQPENAKLGDLFDVNEVYDKDRPEEMGEIVS